MRKLQVESEVSLEAVGRSIGARITAYGQEEGRVKRLDRKDWTGENWGGWIGRLPSPGTLHFSVTRRIVERPVSSRRSPEVLNRFAHPFLVGRDQPVR